MQTISIETVVKRINRKLAHDGERLRRKRSDWAAHGSPMFTRGDYYMVDLDRNVITAEGVDVAALATTLRVLGAAERIAEG